MSFKSISPYSNVTKEPDQQINVCEKPNAQEPDCPRISRDRDDAWDKQSFPEMRATTPVLLRSILQKAQISEIPTKTNPGVQFNHGSANSGPPSDTNKKTQLYATSDITPNDTKDDTSSQEIRKFSISANLDTSSITHKKQKVFNSDTDEDDDSYPTRSLEPLERSGVEDPYIEESSSGRVHKISFEMPQSLITPVNLEAHTSQKNHANTSVDCNTVRETSLSMSLADPNQLWAIRQILREKVVRGELYKLVDWRPTWEKATDIKDSEEDKPSTGKKLQQHRIHSSAAHQKKRKAPE